MKRTRKITLLTCILVIAITAATATTPGCKSKTHHATPTPNPSVAVTVTPTPEPTVTATPTETTTPSETPEATQSSGLTPTPQPSVTATPTATAAPTAQPTATPAQPTPTQTSAPTATQSGGSGGSSPTPTPTPAPTATQIPTSSPNPTQTTAPTPTQTPTTVSINTVAQVKKSNTFTIDINIHNVAYMACATFDLKFNSSCISYISCNATSQIGGGSGTTAANVMEPGLLRVDVYYFDYANAHGGYGISGLGYLCKLTFSATAQGTSQLDFVEGQGAPTGELTLMRWVAWIDSEIENVSWTNSSIQVMNN